MELVQVEVGDRGGSANTGGGGGGRAGNSDGSKVSGTGGSGIVIIRYTTADATISIGAGLTSSTTTSGSENDSFIYSRNRYNKF